jgi:hypothetical protein
MNTADIYKILYIILGFYAVTVSYWLLAAGLFPAFVQRASEKYAAHPAKTLGVGLLTFGPVQLLGWAITSAPNPAVKIVGMAILLISLLLAYMGSAGLALRIGEGLKAEIDERSPWRRIFRGSLVLGLSFNLPLLGWFVVLPATLISGFGAFVLSRRAHAAVVTVPVLPVAAEEAPAISETR